MLDTWNPVQCAYLPNPALREQGNPYVCFQSRCSKWFDSRTRLALDPLTRMELATHRRNAHQKVEQVLGPVLPDTESAVSVSGIV